MLSSNKMTFSLTSLAVFLAFGFAFVPVAMAGLDTEPEPTLNTTDVSAAPGPQVEVFAAIGTGEADIPPIAAAAEAIDTQAEIDALTATSKLTDGIEFFIRLKTGMAALDSRNANVVNPGDADGTLSDAQTAAGGLTLAAPLIVPESLHIHDVSIMYYDKNGIPIAEMIDQAGSMISHRTKSFPDGRNFRVMIAAADIPMGARYMTSSLPAGAFQNAEPDAVQAAHLDKDKSLKLNKISDPEVLRVILVKQDIGNPEVVSIVRVVPTASAATSRFASAAVTGPFNVRITFTEEPLDFTLATIGDRLDIENGTATAVNKGVPFYLAPDGTEGDYISEATDVKAAESVPTPSGRDARYHSYLVTVAPNNAAATFVEIRIKPFKDLVLPPNAWTPPTNLALIMERHLLRVSVALGAVEDIFANLETDATKTAVKAETKLANEAFLTEALVIPKKGYIVFATGTDAQHGITASPAKTADKKTAAQEAYNLKSEFALPESDLSTFLRNGGTIELFHRDIAANTTAKKDDNGYQAASKAYAPGAVVISEIMWGHDASQGADAAKSQWIELHNTTAEDIGIDKYEWVLAFSPGAGAGTTTTIGLALIDTVGNASPYWKPVGSSGATEDSLQVDVKNVKGDEIVATAIETFEVKSLVSMYRKIDGDTVESGTSVDSWAASMPAGTRNFSGLRSGTPGAATPYTAPEAASEPEAAPEPTAPVAKAGDIMISEIMVASNEGRFPQWIEITNGSVGEVSLMGWVVSIANDSADPAVVAASLGIKLDGVTLDAGQSALVVSKLSNRNSGVAARTKDDGNAGALDSNRIVDAQSQVNPPTATYSLLSEMAFQISLQPPLTGGITDRGDVVGNLGGGWELPMSEGDRSSIIRREMNDSGKIMGTDAAGWVLASDTGDGGAFLDTFYGDKDDVGTPGYDAGGALPVELSGFGAKRDPLTGAVVITWSTQSELNNAGFFIKRSQQQKSKFVIVNPTMIAGAGTTAEKQSYTYTDATADPNVIYYYQIEDVSLDGNRQTLTRAHRLKGHIGAAGKATTTWGDLKSSRD